jgi:alpha-tubulin suppressor-like RCC1 family protein
MACVLGTNAKHTAAVTEEGVLFTWGRGDGFQLGLNARDHELLPCRVGGSEVFGSPVVLAAAGSQHSAATTEDGALWTWGHCHLGHGDRQSRTRPTEMNAQVFAGAPVLMVNTIYCYIADILFTLSRYDT